MDPIWNCLLAICCDPLSENRIESLAKFMAEHGDMNREAAMKAAKCVVEYFDLAPVGMLQPLLKLSGQLAKMPPHKD